MDNQSDVRLGFAAATCAYLMWGLLPLYFKLIGFASPLEILAERVVWSVPAAALAVLFMGGFAQTFAALRAPGVLKSLALSAVLIAANWGLYVYAVAIGNVIQASLAYFLAPLVSVWFGVLFFKETLTRAQGFALALAGAGIAVQAVAVGHLPWLSVAICASWSFYALVRKRAPVPAAGGLFVEASFIAPFAAAALLALSRIQPGGLSFPDSAFNATFLILSGAVTATPLILFAFGARRLRFSTLGLLQFMAPTIQLMIGVAFGEPVTPLRIAGFVLIWIGLGAFTWEAITRERARLEQIPITRARILRR